MNTMFEVSLLKPCLIELMALVLLSQSKLQGFFLKLILGWIYAVFFALFLKVIKRIHYKGWRCGLTWFDMEWLDMDIEYNVWSELIKALSNWINGFGIVESK